MANAIVYAGARPIFADVDESLNLDPHAAAAMIGPRTRAIVPVHLHGSPCDLEAFTRLANARGLVLIQMLARLLVRRSMASPSGLSERRSTRFTLQRI